MYDSTIPSQRDIYIWIGGVTFPKMLVSLLGSKSFQCDIQVLSAVSNNTCIAIHIKWTTVVSVLNQIFIDGQVK